MVESLLEAGADPNMALPFGETPLMTAARTGSADAVRQLLAKGAEVDAATQDGAYGAADGPHVGGSRKSIPRSWRCCWLMAPTCTRARARSPRPSRPPRRMRTTVSSACPGTSVTSPRSRVGGFTPVLFAARVGDLDSARLLGAAGADVNEVAADGASALAVAALSGASRGRCIPAGSRRGPECGRGWLCTAACSDSAQRSGAGGGAPVSGGGIPAPGCQPPRDSPATALISSSHPGSSGRRHSGLLRATEMQR